MAMANPRRTHRKRISALRLSSDTTSTLPEYFQWRDPVPPPQYEADADDDADADEDTDSEPPLPYSPPTPVSPRLSSGRLQHRRRPSCPQDAFIDSLLERSVHALELSNALLQSSMTPTSSAFRAPSPTAASAPVPVPPPREPWADDLDAIVRDVDELVSSSLPSVSSPAAHRRPRRRPSLDPIPSWPLSQTASSPTIPSYNAATSTPSGGLHMAPQSRARLVTPAPRALTQYVDADTGDNSDITLPSTLGLRAAPSEWRGIGIGAAPVVSASTRLPEPSTKAYTMLSAIVQRSQSQSPPQPAKGRAASPKIGTRTHSRGRGTGRGSQSSSSCGGSHTPSQTPTLGADLEPSPQTHSHHNPDSPAASKPSTLRSSSFTTHSNLSASIIAQLPSDSSGPSTHSSDEGGDDGGCRAKEARSALRRILDEAPKPPPPLPSRPSQKFQPRTPPPAAHTASSTATASVSRLFSKGGRHSVSTAPERVVGIMKRSSMPSTPIAATGEDRGEGSSKGTGSQSAFWPLSSRAGSGASTPRSAKRISFAELPESYASSKPQGSGSVRGKGRRKGKGKGKGKGKARGGEEDGEGGAEPEGWLAWLVGGSTLGLGLGYGSAEERERIGAGGGARGGHGPGAMWGVGTGIGRVAGEEWAV